MDESIVLFMERYGWIIMVACIVWFIAWHLLRGLWDGTDYIDKWKTKNEKI